ncbi:MAG: U32 family peptidase [Oscillospiraceae bacterium]|nr:U32 family peptidase [Oscillospiraceae bacterium]
MINKTEILAPAGNMENLIAAVYSGANAVYLGVQSFNARASAANFSFEELKKAVGFCHARNVKVNVTLNTILYDRELEEFKETVKQVAACGVDAIIAQDLASAKIIKEVAPTIDLHGSTQMAVHNLAGALLLKEMGYSRVILARELTLQQVEEITKNCGIETEIFVHGALCMSLSGQCYASAFLGGRSGNRGRCAGTCRLPMSAKGDMEDNHLSLKDLCAMEMLPAIEKMGVKCVKIEGRLRTPEYVAAAVDNARKALAGQPFDRQLLADAFSRSGFTNGFLENKLDKNAFGVRTKEDSEKTKETLPKLRALYRREGQYVPVSFKFTMGEDESVLTISDGLNSFSQSIPATLQDTEKDFSASLHASLEKLGGTPFYLDSLECDLIDGKYLPLGAVNAARRNLAEILLAQRETVMPHRVKDYEIPAVKQRFTAPELIARFENIDQIPMDYCHLFKYVTIPVEYADDIPDSLKNKAVLELSRDIFGKEGKIRQQVASAKRSGFTRFCVQNIGHIPLVEGCEIFSSFTLNISNSLAAAEYKKLGVGTITVSPEITLEQIGRITPDVKTAVIGYGHIPLMLVKACPLHNVKTCANCNGKGWLTDRKGMKLPLLCHGKIAGYREIFNPVPLYIGDRQNEINADYVSLNFTVENKAAVERGIKKFTAGQPLGADFTRGLYYKASL